MRLSIRLSKLHRWSLYLIWLVISLSGLYFSWSQDWLMQEPSDTSVNTLKIHGIFATLMLLVIGSLITTHIKLSLHRNFIHHAHPCVHRHRFILQP
jgi:disulfide bond formation protein DsbB